MNFIWMGRYWIYLLMSIIINVNNPVSGQLQDYGKPVVLLDPGHGGMDTGANGINGVLEKDIVLSIAKEAIRLNRELYQDTLEIYLTRYSDTLISLGHRTKLVKGLNADVFVSIHCNQAVRKAAQGIEVYVHFENKDAVELAQRFAMALNQKLGFRNRSVKRANFQVLRETEGVCPSVLLELGFLSNNEEAHHNVKSTSITAYALLILQTLLAHFHD